MALANWAVDSGKRCREYSTICSKSFSASSEIRILKSTLESSAGLLQSNRTARFGHYCCGARARPESHRRPRSRPWTERPTSDPSHLQSTPGRTNGPCYDGYLSGLGLRATGGCKPRQVRKEATVAVRFVCRGLPGAWHLPHSLHVPGHRA